MKNLNKRDETNNSLQLSPFEKSVDQWFGDLFSGSDLDFFRQRGDQKLKVNISEDEKAYYIDASLAGFKKEDVKLRCERNTISIEARKEEKSEESKKNYHRVEYRDNFFQRSFQVPQNVESGKIDAELKDGILKITLPKTEQKQQQSTNVTIR